MMLFFLLIEFVFLLYVCLRAFNNHFLIPLLATTVFLFRMLFFVCKQQTNDSTLSQRMSEQFVAQIFPRLQNMALAPARHAHQAARRGLRLGRVECANGGTTSGTHDYTSVSRHEFDPGRVATNAANFARRIQSRP